MWRGWRGRSLQPWGQPVRPGQRIVDRSFSSRRSPPTRTSAFCCGAHSRGHGRAPLQGCCWGRGDGGLWRPSAYSPLAGSVRRGLARWRPLHHPGALDDLVEFAAVKPYAAALWAVVTGTNSLICLVEPGGIEPPTSCLQSRRSPTELRPHGRHMARNFRPCKRAQRVARAAMKASRARRRWLMACFSAAVISAKVRVSPSGMKIGS